MIRIHHPSHTEVDYTDAEPHAPQWYVRGDRLYLGEIGELRTGDKVVCGMNHVGYMALVEVTAIEYVEGVPHYLRDRRSAWN